MIWLLMRFTIPQKFYIWLIKIKFRQSINMQNSSNNVSLSSHKLFSTTINRWNLWLILVYHPGQPFHSRNSVVHSAYFIIIAMWAHLDITWSFRWFMNYFLHSNCPFEHCFHIMDERFSISHTFSLNNMSSKSLIL